jgi:preprotein translocase subunit SecY
MGTYSMIGEFVNSGTSVIIVVGVVLETIRDLEAQMTMRHYKGFLD